ncbi:MAG: alkaline phosphatase family protein, partial [bacterium]|nr:alkaline phosphatase family protein [bacterium]
MSKAAMSSMDLPMRLRVLGPVFLCLLITFSSACHFRKAVVLPYREAPKAPIRDHYVILVNMDGSRPQEIMAQAQAGALPNIKRLFLDQGAIFENAINVFPTVSLPNHQAFISGLQPGHHGLPALDWFSRPLARHIDYLIPKDMTYSAVLMFNFLQLMDGKVVTDAPQLLFDTLKGHPTLAVLEQSNFGAQTYRPKMPPMFQAMDYSFGERYQSLDFKVMDEFLKHFNSVPFEEIPRFSFVNLYGSDNTAHFDGPDSQRIIDLFIHYDRFIGEIEETLKARGIWDKTTLIVVSDHGNHYLDKIVNQVDLLKQVGLEVNSEDPAKGQVVWGNHGTGTSNLYFKIGDDWKTRPTYSQLRNYPLQSGESIDLVQSFLNHPDIEMVFLPSGPLTTHIFVNDHHARILRQWKNGTFLYRYAPDPGQDPFNYLENPTIAGWVENQEYRSAEDWLRETASHQLPDAVIATSQLFDDYRTGDMIIQTPVEFQFKEDKLAGHGSLDRRDRHVNLMFHGPDIRPGRYPHARIVDTYPTLLVLYGLQNTAPIDGILRKEILQEELLARERIPWGPRPIGKKPLSPRKFRRYLKRILAQSDLTDEEKQKAKQLIYDLRQFDSRWRVVLGTQGEEEEYLATRLSEEDDLE